MNKILSCCLNLSLILVISFSSVAFADDEIPDGGDAKADEYTVGDPPSPEVTNTPEVQTREDKIRIEKVCRFASTQVYGLYQNAQNKVSSEISHKSMLSKLKKQKIVGVDNDVLAQGLVDEVYGMYYKNGKLTKKDKKSDFEDVYFRSCMNNLIK